MAGRPPRQRNRRRAPKKKSPPLPQDPIELVIDKLGLKGDGVSEGYYVAGSLPGEKLLVKAVGHRQGGYVGQIEEILSPSAERVAPPCAYFGTCGGCQLQHASESFYQNWKQELIQTQLSRAGIDVEVSDRVFVSGGHRRRASFSVMRKGKKIAFGFNAHASHRIVEIETCLVLDPHLNRLIVPLRKLLPEIMKQEGQGDVIINDPAGDTDVVFALPGGFELKAHEAMTEFAQKHDVARISWQRDGKGSVEPVIQHRHIITEFSDTPVALPVKPFLQPSKLGEDALVSHALSGLLGERKALDLYAGCGSFTFGLAKSCVVHAVESNVDALKALERAAGQAGLGGRVTTEVRDLERQPLMDKELAGYDVCLFDPPRAGAHMQSEALAKSDIPLVIAVSCNPATFARDCALLIEGGYRLEKVVCVDQFTWSAHVEVVGILRKA